MNARYWPCLGVEVFRRRDSRRPSNSSCLSVPRTKEAQMNRYATEWKAQPCRAHRTQGASKRWQAGGAQAQAGAGFCSPPMPAPVTRRSPPVSALAGRPCTGPSAASCSATLRRRSARSRAQGADRKLSRQGRSSARRHRLFEPAGGSRPAGPWSCWRMNSSGSPSTAASAVVKT